VPGLDGLRAVAVGLVVVFHSGASFSLPGGEIGVDLFMVLSGYLITTLLIAEYQARGSIGIKNFYVRRALRLFPALFVLLLAIVATAFIVDSGYQFTFSSGLVVSCIGAFFYLTDFAVGWGLWPDMAADAPLLHTWSLSVEEHFYLLWAPLLAYLLHKMSVRTLTRVLVATVFAMAAWSLLLDQVVDVSTERLIFSPDTRGIGLALGAAMGAHLWAKGGTIFLPRVVPWLAAAGLLALSTLGLMHDWAGRGFMLLAAAGSAAMIMGVLDTDSAFARMWSWAPLRFVGRRAYGIYLWHFPVFHFLSVERFDMSMVEFGVVKIIATAVLVETSYFLVEKPALRLRRAFSSSRVGPNELGASGSRLDVPPTA
jgi:peptidoglycan/LPS O-acetylase OafA/YrhL